MKKLIATPFRLFLGLPAFYGMSLGNRVLQIGRALGLYRGPIHYVVVPKTIRIKGVGNAVGG